MRREAEEVVVEGEPSKRLMTDIRGVEEVEGRGGGWRERKATKGSEKGERVLETVFKGLVGREGGRGEGVPWYASRSRTSPPQHNTPFVLNALTKSGSVNTFLYHPHQSPNPR